MSVVQLTYDSEIAVNPSVRPKVKQPFNGSGNASARNNSRKLFVYANFCS